MNLKRWVAERELDWKRLEQLADKSQVSVYQLSPQEIRETGLLYRSVLNDLARVRSSPDFHYLIPYLNNLAQRLHSRVYAQPPLRWKSIWEFFVVSFPQCFRKNFAWVALSFFTFVLGSTIAIATVMYDPSTEVYFLDSQSIDGLREGRLWVDNLNAAVSQSSFLMTNNIRVAINSYVGGVLLGIGSLVVMFFNGMFAFGGPLAVCFMHGMGWRLLSFVCAHGPLELSTIFISGGAGMMLGFALLFPGNMSRWEALRSRSWESLVLVAGCVVLLIFAGIIEGMISMDRSMPAQPRVAVGVVSGMLLYLYLGFSGRKKIQKNEGSKI